MGIFDRFRNTPTTLVAHILEPDSGYTTRKWEVGVNISADDARKHSDGENLYIIGAFENGESKLALVPRAIWEQAKSEYDVIDAEGQAFMSRAKGMLGIPDDD